ncbi:hypothetical protein EDS67_23135 [candidate division KSB1 bacterium]|nr:MAG: hypothetical protein EDS67_23135 [candidate division KSB1 bacterium]MBC6947467.1 hypothetical protein [candidate division KSB1 bacterium]MCE7943960.1 hypothetical protein [Chlorobi bacterium CHB1]
MNFYAIFRQFCSIPDNLRCQVKGLGESKSPDGAAYESLGQRPKIKFNPNSERQRREIEWGEVAYVISFRPDRAIKLGEFLFPRTLPLAITFVPFWDWRFLFA